MPALRVIEPPDGEPVTLATAKAFCKADGTTVEDSLFGVWIASARRLCEGELGRPILQTTLQLVQGAFPRARACASLEVLDASFAINLFCEGVQSITAIEYVDQAGATQTLDPTTYALDDVSRPNRVVLAYGKSWPGTRPQVNAVKVTFVAGWVEAADVPQEIRQWILAHVAEFRRNRESHQEVKLEPLPYLSNLLDEHRVWHFA